MTGNDQKRIALTPRDIALLRVLVATRILDVEQVKFAVGFQSTRRANARLLQLYRAGLLKRWFIANRGGAPKAIYGLSLAATRVIGEGRDTVLPWKHDELILTNQFLAHQQGINAVFFALRREFPVSAAVELQWQTLKQPLSSSVPLVPDAYFEVTSAGEILPMFLEVDCGTEPLKTWDKKAELYLKLAATGEFERLFHHARFRVLVIVSSERRLHELRKAVSRRTDKLFWFSTLDLVNEHGLRHSHWRRPSGTGEVGLW